MTSNRLDKLRKLPQSNATWLCTIRRAPFWIFPKGQPFYRPFVVLVMDQVTEFIHKTDTLNERPTPDEVLAILFKAMQGTLLNLGRRSRPTRIFIDNAELTQALTPRLAELDIRCDYRATLPQANAALLEMETYMTKRKHVPGLLSVPGVTVPLVAELYTAAADYFRQAPWHYLENWLPIEVRYPPEGRARYALVLGGGGEIFGLSLYESLDDLDVIFSRTDPEQPTRRPITWLSLVLDEATAMSFADLDALEQYGWPLAGERAYPLAMKSTSNREESEIPTASELTWLAAALRVLPGFVTQHLRIHRWEPAQATYSLPGVHGGQQVFLRFPAETSPVPKKTGVPTSPIAEQDNDLQELEEYIGDWYGDEASHAFARQMGAFLFQFFDHLEASDLSRQTIRKHESNCWCIGWLECDYGYRDTFTPAIFLDGPSYLSEFKRKVSDSKYAVDSYQATWRKLERYVRSFGYGES